MKIRLCGVELDKSLFKKRKGFGFIVIDGEQFQYNWAENHRLILYNIQGKKIEIPYEVWKNDNHSEIYLKTKSHGMHRTWHGKNKRGPNFAGWGKAEAAEMYRKFKKLNKSS